MGVTAPIVVVTDLDGTLLDQDTYMAGPAAARVTALQAAGVTIVCCSAKARAEQLVHRRELRITGPFVVENGAAVHDDAGPLRVLGLEYDDVRQRLRRAARALGATLRGFGDMDDAEVARRTLLTEEAAARARRREHTEPFVVVDAELDEAALRAALGAEELRLQRGARFWTASGEHDKGNAVAVLRELCTTAAGERPLLYGLGDTYNDAAMLAAVDVPMLVRRPDGTWADIDVDCTHVDGVGPAGWAEAADSILATTRAP